MRKLILAAMLIIGLSGIMDDSQAVQIIEHIRFPNHFVENKMIDKFDKNVKVKFPTKHSDVECLAKNIFFESYGQGEKGMTAVGNVTNNRLKSGKFGNSICNIVYQKDTIKSGGRWKTICQFSWYCDRKSNTPTNTKGYTQSVIIAKRILSKQIPDITKGSLYFHAKYVKPAWSKSYRLVAIIGDHKFYRPHRSA